MLELGSGLGRVTEVLARETPSVVGLDISVEMLRRASRRLARLPAAALVAADMRRFAFSRRFDLIAAGSDPFTHLTTLAGRRAALRASARHLTPGGHLVIDGLYRPERRPFEKQRRVGLAHGSLSIRESWEPAGRDLWSVRYRYRRRDGGTRGEGVDAGFLARAWDAKGLSRLFASCGLTVETTWGGFTRRPLSRDAPRIVIVARLTRRSRGLPDARISTLGGTTRRNPRRPAGAGH